MDDNKLQKLIEHDYVIHACCGMCKHGNFLSVSKWGTCKLHKYEHKKHTGGDKGQIRELSIVQYGHCNEFEWFDHELQDMQHFDRFINY